MRVLLWGMLLYFCTPLFVSLVHAKTIIAWEQIQKGIELANIPVKGTNKPIVLIRFIPRYFSFAILSSTIEKREPLPITEWEKIYPFISATNASMFAEDSVTSVGYLKSKDIVNNGDFPKTFGAVFLSGPKEKGLPSATILDHSSMKKEDIEKEIKKYSNAVQNYRMIDNKGEVVWKAYSNTPSTMSAVAVDAQKRIIFIHSQALLTQNALATILVELPLDIRTTMYTEGGKEAILLLNTARIKQTWFGLFRNPFIPSVNVPIPNIIAVYPKK